MWAGEVGDGSDLASACTDHINNSISVTLSIVIDALIICSYVHAWIDAFNDPYSVKSAKVCVNS